MRTLIIISLVFSILSLITLIILATFIILNKNRTNKNENNLSLFLESKFKNYFDVLEKNTKLLIDNKIETLKTNNSQNMLKTNEQINIKINELIEKLNKSINDTKAELIKITTINQMETRTKIIEDNKKLNDDLNNHEKIIKESIENKINDIDNKNKEWFEKIKQNINEHFEDKLTKQIKEHFSNIQVSMNKMNEGMIQFSTLQKTVVDLNKVFSNSKNIGNFGETTLEEILNNHYSNLKDELWFKQYKIDTNSQEAVDFAIKTKTKNNENEEIEIIIPIDCKFPSISWEKYLCEENRGEQERKLKEFKKEIELMAKSISEKYIKPNKRTTHYAIMFIPSESIFAELLRDSELISSLFSRYKVQLLSPTFITSFIHSFFVLKQNYEVSKNIDKIKDIFNYVRDKYEKINANVLDSQKAIKKAGEKIKSLHNNSQSIIKKINEGSKTLNMRKIDLINDNIENWDEEEN